MKTQIRLFLSCLIMIIYACGDSNDPLPPEPELPDRTVLVYMVADNSLSSLAGTDIKEMMEGMAEVDDSTNNLLVYIDDNEAPQLIRLEKNAEGKVIRQEILAYEEQNSVDVAVMKEVFSYVFDNYPAKSYGLALWSHGEGWLSYPRISSRSFGQDSSHGNAEMNISDLREVLSNYRFDFILFDACFMQAVEVIYELRACSDYFIGSPTEIPGPGAPYQTVVKAMFAGENVAENIGRCYFDYYEQKYNGGINMSNSNWTGGVSVSVLKSEGIEKLASITKSIFIEYLDGQTDVDTSGMLSYDKRSTSYYYDFEDFIRSLTGDNELYAAWCAAYAGINVYFKTTPKNYSGLIGGMFSMTDADGLSIYIPKMGSSRLNTFYASYEWYAAVGWDVIIGK